jgi:hypothetical protein
MEFVLVSLLVLPPVALAVYEFTLSGAASVITSPWVVPGTLVVVALELLVYLAATRCNPTRRDALFLLHVGVATGVLSGNGARIGQLFDGNLGPGLLLIFAFPVYYILYTLTFRCDRAHTILVDRLPPQCVPIILGLVLALASLAYTSWRVSGATLAMFLSIVAAVLVLHVVLFCSGPRHIHHWYWPLPLMVAFIFDTWLCHLAQPLLLAVHVHGIARFQAADVFQS